MKRILSSQAIEKIGEKIKVSGWVQSVRLHGKIVFIDLRDRKGIIQLVFTPNNQEVYDLSQTLKDEWIISVEGIVKERPEKMINPEIESGTIELNVEKIEILSKIESLPFELNTSDLSLTNLLDHRPLTLRSEKAKAICEEVKGTLKEVDSIIAKNNQSN